MLADFLGESRSEATPREIQRLQLSDNPFGLPIRVVLAEVNLLVREGLRQLLATVEDIDVVAVCEGRDDLFETIERESPDVVLTDIRMPPGHGTEGIEVANVVCTTRGGPTVELEGDLDADDDHQEPPDHSDDRGDPARVSWARS